jgi:putative inorganic carbon (HCO3(-)) transporter
MNRPWVLNLRLVAPKALLVVSVVVLGVALALLPGRWAALLVVGGILLFALLIRPQCTLCLLAFAVPFGAIRGWPLGPVNVGSAELLILLLLAFWLARMIAARRIIIPQPPLVVPLLLFLTAILLSTLVTSSLELSAKELVKWLEVLIIYLFMADVVDERWGKWVVWSLLAAGSAEALVGVYQFLRRVGPEGFILFERFMRAYGHFAQPNPFAGYLGLTLPLAYALTLEALEVLRLRVWRTQAGIRRALAQMMPYVAFVASFVVMSAAMVMSWSRGGWVGLAAALIVITVIRSRAALISVIAVGLVVTYLLLIGGAQYLPSTLVKRVSDFVPYLGGVDVTRVDVTDANWAVIERMAHWLAAVGMFSDHPWLGVGIGNYPVAYPQYAQGRWRDPLGHAHNYYLNIAAEAGIIGLGAYLILFGACFVQAWRVIQYTRSPAVSCAGRSPAPARKMAELRIGWAGHGYWRAVALGALGVLVHLCVHSLFDNLFVHSMYVQLGLVLGLLVAARKSVDARHANRH